MPSAPPRPYRWSAALFLVGMKFGIKQLLGGVAKESERRAANG